ncbi:MAG: hypothetical protein WC471_04500 [Candidatus Woesearchaeota archaeon]
MVHEIKIVESIKKYNEEINEKMKKGRLTKPESDIIMTPEIFNKVFSPERIKLLQKVYKNNVKNIYQLAKELNKPYEVVFRNIKYLEGIGLVKIIERNKKKFPHIANRFSINMFSNNEMAA